MNMNAMRINLRLIAIYGTVSVLLILSSCFTPPETPFAVQVVAPAQTGVPCEACAQATLIAAQTQ
jgi:hypothetical protein